MKSSQGYLCGSQTLIQQIFTKCSLCAWRFAHAQRICFLMNNRDRAPSLYMEWTLKDLEEFYEESCKKQPWQRFRDKIKMVDRGEQRVYLGHFCLWKPKELDTTSVREEIMEALDKSKE